MVIRVLPMDTESGQLEMDELPTLLNKRTRLVAVGAAATVIERLGVERHGGLVRAGCSVYTTPEEAERLVEGIRAFVSERR